MIVHERWSWLIPRLTMEQVVSMRDRGFDSGLEGYPIMLSENGRVTVFQEMGDLACLWEFDADGSAEVRYFRKQGRRRSDIFTTLDDEIGGK